MRKQGLRKLQNMAHEWWSSDLNLGLTPKTKILAIALDYFASEFEVPCSGCVNAFIFNQRLGAGVTVNTSGGY